MSDESAKDEMDNEDLRRQIDQTRSDLSEKLTELEAQVAGTIQSTGTAIDDTMSSIRGAVVNVKTSLSLRHQIEQHPWIAVGSAVVTGILAEALIAKATRPTKPTSVRLLNPIPDGYRVPQPTIVNTLQSMVQNAAIQSVPLVLNLLLQHWTGSSHMPESPPDDRPDGSTVSMSGSSALYSKSPVRRSTVS